MTLPPTAINLYHAGDLPARFLYIQDGKVVLHRDLDFRRPYWVEGYGQQLSSQNTIPDVVPEPSTAPPQSMSKSPSNQQLAHRTVYNYYRAQGLGHERISSAIHTFDTYLKSVRYLHELGRFRGLLSTAFSIDITMLNDTGSNTLTVFNTALLALAIPPDYLGFGANIPITTAGGMVRRQQITVEIQLLDSQGNAVSDWVLKQGIVTPATTGACRLSGNGIRQSLYFATAPGNQHLYVAEKKNGIVEQLPAL
ncbi:hypothetical protein CIRG_03528 [Coccidioides immitis RMSCC 2394]|uniref:Uncharacterized protein n=1 Tax=Coccidioides immitis RMSCC 2394 TaxID=404692 RepID=A0A0J6Y596_COCIT|nr:hypothetical protein CIRG_03528 [Coccidioides immitis RMSCC 2394]